MSKILASMAAFALVSVLALPGPASAAERRADGLRTTDATSMTDVSAYRRWGRGYWGPRYGFYRPYWRPRYAFYRPYWRPRYAFYRPYWRPRYAYWGAPYSYGYNPYFYRPRPVFALSIGFGPRWGWGGPRYWW
jgi:hypothetical protein